MKKYIEQIRRSLENLKPENRVGVIAKVLLDKDRPHKSKVIVDRGKRDVEYHGIQRDFVEAIVSTTEVVKGNWNIQDLVYVGWFGTIKKIASFQELKNRGENVDEIYRRFMNWIKFEEEANRRIEKQPRSEDTAQNT